MATPNYQNMILDLKDQIKEKNSKITYNLSVKQRMEQERKYIDNDSCRIMMSAMDRKMLQEIHVPMCLDRELSLTIIDTSIKYCNDENKKLKDEVAKLKKQLTELESKTKKEVTL